jgi:5-methylcytosine-specific restriction endonuclease McrA
MLRHTKLYLAAMGYDETDFIPCEVCGKKCVDVHHIEGRGKMGGPKAANFISNLIGLCRECHLRFGDKKQYKEFLKKIHHGAMERSGRV